MSEYRVRLTDDSPRAQRLLDELAQVASVEPVGAAVPTTRPSTTRSSTTLVLGGARSGKSYWAESQFGHDDALDYVATSAPQPDDPEWVARVDVHRSRRPGHWRTIETLDVAGLLAADDPTPVLVDCLTLWLTHQLDRLDAWQQPVENWRQDMDDVVRELVHAVASTRRHVVLVSNEVGSGVVPATASGRLFQDELGRLNAQVAARCDHVVLCTAGIAQKLK